MTGVPEAGRFVPAIEIAVGVSATTGVGTTGPSVGPLSVSVPGTAVVHGLSAKIIESVAVTEAVPQRTASGELTVTVVAPVTVPVAVISLAVPPAKGVPAPAA